MITPELRQLRYVVEVAEQRSFTRAAERLHVAQQALSQQVRVVEDQLGLELFRRTSRGVEPTPPGAVFVEEARRVIAAAERTVARAQAAARGEAGGVRLAYTLTSVYDTLPSLLDELAERCPLLRVDLREVVGGDVDALLLDGRHDVALVPRTTLPAGLARRPVRREPLALAVAERDPRAGAGAVALGALAGDVLELWPREVAPGYYDTVVAACREAGFEPRVDEHASGATVWGRIAQGRGVGLVVGSLRHQVPRGVALVALEAPAPALTIDLVWHEESAPPAVARVAEAAGAVAERRGWGPA